MKRTTLLLIIALTAGIAVGQTGSSNQTQPKQGQQPKGGMMHGGMSGMMEHCQMHCRESMTSMNTLHKQVEEARQSNDQAKMRAALDAVSKHHAEMQKHMQMCMQNSKSAAGAESPGARTPGNPSSAEHQHSPATKKK